MQNQNQNFGNMQNLNQNFGNMQNPNQNFGMQSPIQNFGMRNSSQNFGMRNSSQNFGNMQNPTQNFGNLQSPTQNFGMRNSSQNFGNMPSPNQNFGNMPSPNQNFGNLQTPNQNFGNLQTPNQNFGNMQNPSKNVNSKPSKNLKTKVSISNFQEPNDPKSIEFAYSFILRCCLFPYNQSVTDFYCNQRIGAKFKSYIYKKKLSGINGINGINLKPPKPGYNNIDSISKYLYSLSLQDFYKTMDESSNFKDYLIFFARITYIQIKKYTSTYCLTDENNDSVIIESIDSFVQFFKEFALKHLENFKVSQYSIFQKKVYFSFIITYLKVPSNINKLEADNDIQNWARKIFKIDSRTHEKIVNYIKRTINQTNCQVATLADFKRYLGLIEVDKYENCLPGDFYSRDLYEMWKKMEKTEIVKNITSLQSTIIINASNQSMLLANNFYFIPPEPYIVFKQLVEQCIYKDCETFEGEDKDILSEKSRTLIEECEYRWRIPKAFKKIIILDVLVQNYLNNFVKINEIIDIIQNFIEYIDINNNIRTHEIKFLCSIFDGLVDKLMNDISHVFQYVNDIRDVQPFILDNYATISLIQKSKLYQTYLLKSNIHTDIARYICDNFKVATDVNYKNIELTIFNTQEDKTIQTMKYFTTLKDNIDNFQSVNISSNKLDLLKVISTVYYDNAIKFLPEVYKDGKLEYHFDDLFEIFKFLKNLNDQANYSARSFIKVEEWFKEFVKKWLSASDETIKSRIENIIKIENYEPINVMQKIYHSDSVLDLFKHFDLVLSSINQIEWSKVTDHAEFIKQFSRSINKLIFEYIKRMNLSFAKLSYNPSYSDDLFKLVGSSSEDIKNSEIFKKLTEITNTELIIKINNMYKTYNLLEKICENSDVPYYHNILISQNKSKNKANQNNDSDTYNMNDDNVHFRISVLKVENLESTSAGFVSPFVEMNLGTNQLFRTNSKQKTLNPQYYEEFIIKITKTTSSVLNIKVKNGEGKSVTLIGQTKLLLRSVLFDDGLIHTVKLPIAPHGLITLRICKLKAIDEIRYYILNISEFLDYTIEDICSLVIKLISSVVVGYINKVVDINKNMEIQSAESQLIPIFEYLNEVLLKINTYLDLNFIKYVAEKIDHPVFRKYTIEENMKKMENDEAISQRQQERMRMATQIKFKRTFTRLQTLMRIVKNQNENDLDTMRSRKIIVNDLLNEDLFKDYDYDHLPSNDVILLIWDKIVKDLHELIFQNYDINGNSINEKSKISTKLHNFMTSWNMPKNIENKMGNIIFNQRSVGIINNTLELLKSFFACEIDETCYGFSKDDLETENYIKLKNYIKLIRENNKNK